MVRVTQCHVIVSVAAFAAITQAVLADRGPGEFIVSGHTDGSFGETMEFKGFDFQFAVDEADGQGEFFPERFWLFELNGLNAANEGHTWIADKTHPNFGAAEAFLTNGSHDVLYARFDSLPPIPKEHMAEIGRGEHLFFHGDEDYPDPWPDEPKRADLAGYDLTEIHLTFEQLDYGSKEIFPGVVVWGYEFVIRVDFFGHGPCASDIGGDTGKSDGVVNLFDLLALLANWGTDGRGAEIAEPSDVVNLFDLLELLAAWGACS